MRQPSEKILVRGVNWLGDAVMTTQALQRIREAFPDAQITLLSPAKLAALFEHHPAVDSVMAVPATDSILQVAGKIRAERFDRGLVLPNSFRSALELALGGVRKRIGYAGNGRSPLLHQKVERPSVEAMRKRTVAQIQQLRAGKNQKRQSYPLEAHHLHQYLNLAKAFGASNELCAPTLRVLDTEITATQRKLNVSGRGGPVFALNPGAEYGPAKRWPAESFIETAVQVQNQTQCRWLVVGGPNDRELTTKIVAGINRRINATSVPAKNLAGETSLRELMAVLASAQLLLTNDTGPMHVAAALGTPVVVPFGSTSFELTGPGLPGDPRHQFLKGQAACAPCFLRECPVDFLCMNSISVASAVKAVLHLVSPAR